VLFDRSAIKQKLTTLAQSGIFIGASSWKYAGWIGTLYDEQRYIWRGKFGEKRFERYCLQEYAEVFKTVCVDAAYYKFPDDAYLQDLVCLAPPGFLFGFKVTDEITIKKFPNLPRFGIKAGKLNEHFLNADLFASAFLKPLEKCKDKVGIMIYEFSKFYTDDFKSVGEFIPALEKFLALLPKGWPYGIEIRNKYFLVPEYFALLKQYGITHVFNSWNEMPSVLEQLSLDGCRTNLALTAARFLLKPGRDYETAVKLFKPYDRIKEPNPEARAAAVKLIQQHPKPGKTFIFVNNRLEGNALETIASVLGDLAPES
jgi:uncharacterized protein YecE (DUF72 family)